MLLGVAGISLGFKGKVLLAGGTQMVAASAVIKELGREKIKDVGIGTTRWIVEDKSSDIIDLARQTGVKLSFVNLDFSKSRFDGLRAYERGFVKEGVGAGGLSLFATLQGISEERILSKVEEIYENLLKEAK
ncbi:MAG: TIGR00303 family protein, partial [Candidatus Aramenus sp.]|nr:TIGR00303 family protein [Candidatus Aramenus sp.]